MKKRWVVAFLALCGMPWGGYAQNPPDQAINQDWQKLRQDYQAKVDKDLRHLGRRISHLKYEASQAEASAQADLNARVKDLKAQKRAADHRFSRLKKSTDEAWKDLRGGMDEAVSNLKASVDEATAHFKR
jgi:uncharacterized protein (DUF3084 family)